MQLGFGLSLNQPIVSGSLTPSQMLEAIAPDQALLVDSSPHYTNAQWPGFEHLLRDAKPTVGTLRTPRAGRCWLFDGTDDIATASTALLTGTGDFTICCWLKASSVSIGHIAGNYATGNSGGVQFALNTGKLQLYLGSALVGSTTLSTNTWYHVAAVRQSGVVTIYLDAISDGSGTRSSSITGSTNFSFGALTAGGERLSGKLRDLRVYNSAKSAAEILAIKNQADTPGTYDTTSLLAGYWCEEESGTTGYDWSGNGRNLTLTNITQSTFHASDTGVTYSDANVRGARQSKTIIYTSGGSSWTDGVTFLSGIALTGSLEIEVGGFAVSGGAVPVCGMQSESTKTATNNYSNIDCGVQYNNSTTLRVWVNGTSSDHTVSSYDSTAIAKIVRSGTTASIYLNGVLVTTKTVSSGTMYAVSTFQAGGAAQTIRMLYNSGINIEQDNAGVGSNLTSGMFIMPAVSSTLAADGNALTVTGKCPQPGYAPQRVATFDGTNDYATLGARLTSGTLSTLTISAWIKPQATGLMAVCSEWNGGTNNAAWAFYLNNYVVSMYLSSDGNSATPYSSGSSLTANAWAHIAVTYSSGALKMYVAGVEVYSTTATQTSIFNTTEGFRAGSVNGGFYFNGSIADVRAYSNAKSAAEILAIKRGTQDTTNLLGQWPMCEGPGSGNTNTTIYDVSGNGKHLTITNATISSFWANASTYDSCIPNHPLKYGYTIDGSGVVVPAKLDGLLDAAGNAIGQAAGGWASGLQNLNCLPYTNPLGVSVGLETSLDPTADRKTTSSSKRRRRNTSGRYDRFGARSTAMSDASSNAYFGD